MFIIRADRELVKMLGKLVVLCFCLALVSAKPARSVRFSPHHFGLVKSCDTDEIMSAVKSIAEETSSVAATVAVEIAKVKAGVALCSDPLEILLCASKGLKEILTNSKLIVSNVKTYLDDMKTEVPALVSNVKACL